MNADTRGEASATLAAISTFQFLNLSEFDSVQNYLQTKGLVPDESLHTFVTDQGDSASQQSNKELDFDRCNALTLLQWPLQKVTGTHMHAKNIGFFLQCCEVNQ